MNMMKAIVMSMHDEQAEMLEMKVETSNGWFNVQFSNFLFQQHHHHYGEGIVNARCSLQS